MVESPENIHIPKLLIARGRTVSSCCLSDTESMYRISMGKKQVRIIIDDLLVTDQKIPDNSAVLVIKLPGFRARLLRTY